MNRQTMDRIHALPLWVALGLLVSMLPASARSQQTLLPVHARQAINSAFPGARIGEVERESENGVRYYEVDVTWQGRELEVEVTGHGALGEIQEDVELDALPAAVIKALLTQVTDRQHVRKIEVHEIRGTPADGTFAPLPTAQIVYEIKARTPDGSKIEVRLDPVGKVLAAEDEGDDHQGDNEGEDHD